MTASLERPDSPKVQPADTTNQEELDDERALEDARAATSESEAEDRSKSPKIKSDQGQGGPANALCAPLPPDAAPEVTPNQPNTLELLQKHTEKALQNTMSGGSFLLNGLGAFPDEANGEGRRGEGKDNYFRYVGIDFSFSASCFSVRQERRLSHAMIIPGTDAVSAAKYSVRTPRCKSTFARTPERGRLSVTFVEIDSPPREILRCTSSGTKPSIRMLR